MFIEAEGSSDRPGLSFNMIEIEPGTDGIYAVIVPKSEVKSGSTCKFSFKIGEEPIKATYMSSSPLENIYEMEITGQESYYSCENARKRLAAIEDKSSVLFASTEMEPFARKGGLGDALDVTKALATAHNNIRGIMPKYTDSTYSKDDTKYGIVDTGITLEVSIGRGPRSMTLYAPVRIMKSTFNGFVEYFIESKDYFETPYRYKEKTIEGLREAILLSMGAVDVAKTLGFGLDAVDYSEWQTALIRGYLEPYGRQLANVATVQHIDHLSFKGEFPLEFFDQLLLPEKELEDFLWNGDKSRLSLLKYGLKADRVRAPSEQYAQEITRSHKYGLGLEGFLGAIAEKITGINTGVDYDRYDPSTNENIDHRYSGDDMADARDQKARNRVELSKRMELDPPGGDGKSPLIGIATRLVDKKGLHLYHEKLIPSDLKPEQLSSLPADIGFDDFLRFCDSLPSKKKISLVDWIMEHTDAQIAMLGATDSYAQGGVDDEGGDKSDGGQSHLGAFLDLGNRYGGRFTFRPSFSRRLADQIYSAADIHPKPTEVAPCEVSPQIAMRYGVVPVVRATGGLMNTVTPDTGFLFPDITEEARISFIGAFIASSRSAEKRDVEKTVEAANEIISQVEAIRFLRQLYAAIDEYSNNKSEWNARQDRCFRADHSWDSKVPQFESLYRDVRATHMAAATSTAAETGADEISGDLDGTAKDASYSVFARIALMAGALFLAMGSVGFIISVAKASQQYCMLSFMVLSVSAIIFLIRAHFVVEEVEAIDIDNISLNLVEQRVTAERELADAIEAARGNPGQADSIMRTALTYFNEAMDGIARAADWQFASILTGGMPRREMLKIAATAGGVALFADQLFAQQQSAAPAAVRRLELFAMSDAQKQKVYKFIVENRTKAGMPLSYRVVTEKHKTAREYWESVNHDPEDHDSIIERLLTEGLNIYDGACGQIVESAIMGETERADKHTAELLKGSYIYGGNLQTVRANSMKEGERFTFNGKSVGHGEEDLDPSNALFFRMWPKDAQNLQQDPIDGKRNHPSFLQYHPDYGDYINHEDWKPIAGENAWAALIGPLNVAHSKYKDAIPLDCNEVKLALSILPAIEVMQSPIGGIYHAPEGTADKDPADISNENNISMFAGLEMLLQILDQHKTKPGVKEKIAIVRKILYGEGARHDGIEGYFKEHAISEDFDPSDPKTYIFDQGGFYMGGRLHHTKQLAVDVQTWGLIVFGAERIDKWYGEGAAMKIWQNTRREAGYLGRDGVLRGIGYTNGHDISSSEWGFGAVMASRSLARYYKDSHEDWSIEAENDSINMRRGIEEDLKIELDDGSIAYKYANKRYPIPFGWWANPIPSLCACSWAIMVDNDVVPFILGGGPYAKTAKTVEFEPESTEELVPDEVLTPEIMFG
ncbi:MAG: glycogen/starch synthase, partial [Candidatus Omnitrophota bacterium]